MSRALTEPALEGGEKVGRVGITEKVGDLAGAHALFEMLNGVNGGRAKQNNINLNG